MAKKQRANLDYSFFEFLREYYENNKGTIHQSYRQLTRKFLGYNDPSLNDTAFLRKPQFEALEIYVFLKEYFDNKTIRELVYDWHHKKGKFSEEGNWVTKSDALGQMSFYDLTDEDYAKFEAQLESVKTTYPNYIFALTMGLGKTILMATCIFYEFLLARKWPKDKKYCHNVIVFAPDKTVLQSLREIPNMDKTLVIPPEYVSSLEAEMKFHFLDDTSTLLTTTDGSDFNIIITNNQKFLAKQRRQELTSAESLFQITENESDRFFSKILGEVLGNPEIISEANVNINHRFNKLSRLPQIGVFVDEAHHLYGTELVKELGENKKESSLRYTVNLLDGFLREQGTNVVACYNYTGTPYVNNVTLPEVVYGYGLRPAILNGYLKRADIIGYKGDVREEGFLLDTIIDFWEKYGDKLYEGLKPKMAIFGSSLKEVQDEILPEIEHALNQLGIPLDTILVNTEESSSEEVRDFNNLDIVGTNGSQKQFIILIEKGREGWNCRSLFGVAMHRRPGKKVYVLQATMRCLRQITNEQQTATIYLSEENRNILNDELRANYKVTVEDLKEKPDKRTYYIRVNPPEKKIELKRIRHKYTLIEKHPTQPIEFKLEERKLEIKERYGMERITQKIASVSDAEKHEEFIDQSDTFKYSELTLIAEIARYLNISPLIVENILQQSTDGIKVVLTYANEFKSLIMEEIIPTIFNYKYGIETETFTEDHEVSLLKEPEGETAFYRFNGKPEMVIRDKDELIQLYKYKSFHADTYVFDSKPEREMFLQYLENNDVIEIYFTGMFTRKQGDFYIQYIDPVSHRVRNYFPDFVVMKEDGSHEIIEVKGDNKKDDPVVQAKKAATEEQVGQSGYKYRMLLGSEIMEQSYKI